MVWNRNEADKRIRKHLTTVPELDLNISLSEHFERVQKDRAAAKAIGRGSNGHALLVRCVHLYGVLLDFDDLVSDNGVETEATHARVLTFLNAHFRVWDAIVDSEGATRVDYHGPRLHAIVTQPAADEPDRIAQAVALAHKLTLAAHRVGAEYGFPSRIRFGVDTGNCLAMSTGRDHEQDILYLGSPANHAAKLAEAESTEGIFLSDNAKLKLGEGDLRKTDQGTFELSEDYIQQVANRYRFESLDRATEAVAADMENDPQFNFFRPMPPLFKLKFADLMPSHSARIGASSLFADIDGFTAYVDNAINHGEAGVREAVKNIHVLREELNDVLQRDFGGKRVRFVGDCIQGLLAEGDAEDSPTQSVTSACMCASGMRSSFSLAQEIVGGMDELDLAVGVEYGQVPVTRIGKRGAESIRSAAGAAVIASERCQKTLEGGGIVLGANALRWATSVVKENFQNYENILSYSAAADLLEMADSPVASTVQITREARPHSELP